MNPRLSWHLCKRDLTGPLKPWILAWFGVCLLHLGMRLWQTLGGLSLEWLETRWRFDFILVLVTAALIVPRLIHEESWVDGPATWRARPLAKRTVLLARGIFIGLVFVIVPALMELVYFTVCGYGERTRECMGAWFKITSIWIPPLVALTIVTRSSKGFISFLLGLAITIILAQAAISWMHVPDQGHGTRLSFWLLLSYGTNLLWVCLLVVLMSAVVIAFQIRWRRPWLSKFVLVLGIAMLAAFVNSPGLGRMGYSREMPERSILPEIEGDFSAEIGLLAKVNQPDFIEGGVAIRVTAPSDPARMWGSPHLLDYHVAMANWKHDAGIGYHIDMDPVPGWLTPGMTPFPAMRRSRAYGRYWEPIWDIYGQESAVANVLGYTASLPDLGPNPEQPAVFNATVGLISHEPDLLTQSRLEPGLVWRDGGKSVRILSVGMGADNSAITSTQHGDRTQLTVVLQYEYPFVAGSRISSGYPFRFPFGCVLLDGESKMAAQMDLRIDYGKGIFHEGHYDASRRVMIQQIKASLYLAPEILKNPSWAHDPQRTLLLLRSRPVAVTKIPVQAPYLYLASPFSSLTKEEERSAAVEALSYDPESGESIKRYAIDLLNLMQSNILAGPDAGIEAIAVKLRGIAEGNVPMLLDLAANCSIGGGGYRQGREIVSAVTPFIGPEHKEAVVELLARYSDFDVLPIVRRMGWQADALPVMIEGAERTSLLPRAWAEFMIESGDKRCYETLLFHAARGDFGYGTEFFDSLKELPGFPSERLVDLKERCQSLFGDPLDFEIQKP